MHHLGRAALAALSAAAVLLTAPAPAQAASESGTDSRPVSSRVFSASSPFYQLLPASTPVAPDSAAMVASLKSQAHKYYGTPTIPNIAINTNKYSTPLYVARKTDPVFDITAWNCQSHTASVAKYLNDALKKVHVPADLKPDPSSDGSVSIYNPDTKDLVELWRARKTGSKWEACWGGRIANADKSLGTFSGTFGASASGMAQWATTIRQQELLNGRIDHVVGLAIPQTKKGHSWPAVRDDGWWTGTQLSIGQMLRLPASLNIDAMKLSPVAKTIAKAAQQYGIIITDTSGSVSFSAENPIALATDRYSTIFRGRAGWAEMAGDKAKGEIAFPLEKLVALPMNYKAPVTSSTPPVQAPAPQPPVQAPPAQVPSPTPGTTNSVYPASVKSAAPWLHWRLSDTSRTTATDASGNGRPGTLVNVITGRSGAVAGNNAIVTYGNQNSYAYSATPTTPAKSFSVQLWFKTTTEGGGKLAGFESAKTGASAQHDRSLYLTNNGKLIFGTYAGGISTVTSTRSYNDGAWHMVTATQGADGTRLYVDGALVASSTVTAAQAGTGYWRLGGGSLKGWPSAPGSYYVQATLDEFAVYSTALGAATVAAQYKAAG